MQISWEGELSAEENGRSIHKIIIIEEKAIENGLLGKPITNRINIDPDISPAWSEPAITLTKRRKSKILKNPQIKQTPWVIFVSLLNRDKILPLKI